MNYKQTLARTARTAVRNPVGLATASVLLSLTALPVFVVVPYGTAAVLGGLWTTCLLFGVGLVGTFRFATTAVDRGARVGVRSSFVAAGKHPSTGLKLGGVLFVLVVGLLASVENAPDAYRPTVVGIAAFLVLSWYVVIAFACPELADGARLGVALRTGATRAGSVPMAVVVFVVGSGVCAVVAGLTVIAVFLFLPALLALLAAQFATAATGPSDQG